MAGKQHQVVPSSRPSPNGAARKKAGLSEEPVLLVAEPGVARTMLGRMLNFLGRHAHAPFLVVACGVLTPDLLDLDSNDPSPDATIEQGHKRTGLLEQARGGTLFLDGIDHLSAPQQARLLEALPQAAAPDASRDVRLFASISEPPTEAVQAGHLSPELLERFTVVDLTGSTAALGAPASNGAAAAAAPAVTVSVGRTLADMEKAFIIATMDHCNGDKRRSAAMLGISLRTLYNRLHDWKIVDAWNHRAPQNNRVA